ncbi:Site-2 protease family protein [Sulfidibacter corallicola]|uniref:Site-2 protease family protein n=1 Tax=Sulfidibacter corallicola TaxID=2818388 RepID=A0A8A4TTV4_SULCO|nr:site-2 protease family protein [Sulfidibacter corallicola]QTD52521.1 site-2 protease family protein [Sulfidibacter corallicola]
MRDSIPPQLRYNAPSPKRRCPINTDLIILLLLWSISFTFSLTLHEAAHALVGKLGGDLTAYATGQVSLNPIPHMKREPMGMIVIPLVSFFIYNGGWMLGWASAPYDPIWAERHPRKSALMALAGPVSNLILFILSAIAYKMLYAFGTGMSEELFTTLAMLALIMYKLNLILALFNFIPLPPLDGAEIILLFFPENQASMIRARIRSLGIFGLFLAWILFPYIYRPIRAFFSALLGMP